MSGKHDIADVMSTDDRHGGRRDDSLALLRWSRGDRELGCSGRCRCPGLGRYDNRRAGGDSERGDEDVHQQDEVEEVSGAVLPERHLAERRSLLQLVSPLLHVDGAVSLSLGQPLLGLALRLLSLRGRQVVARPRQLRLEVGVAAGRRLAQRVLDDAHVAGGANDPHVGVGRLHPRQLDRRVGSFQVDERLRRARTAAVLKVKDGERTTGTCRHSRLSN